MTYDQTRQWLRHVWRNSAARQALTLHKVRNFAVNAAPRGWSLIEGDDIAPDASDYDYLLASEAPAFPAWKPGEDRNAIWLVHYRKGDA